MALTLFGILIGIGLAFVLELTPRRSLRLGLFGGLVAVLVGALMIRFLDDQLVTLMRLLLE